MCYVYVPRSPIYYLDLQYITMYEQKCYMYLDYTYVAGINSLYILEYPNHLDTIHAYAFLSVLLVKLTCP